MQFGTFFYKSFGILALLAAMLALLACHGSYAYGRPIWMIVAPLILSAFFLYGGIRFLRKPRQPNAPLGGAGVWFLKVFIGLAALGGLLLTNYFHGDSAEDKSGIQMLHEISSHYLILGPIALVVMFLFFRKKKSRFFVPAVPTSSWMTKTSDKPPSPTANLHIEKHETKAARS